MEKTVWDFVQQYYPNYGRSQEIAENDDLQVLIDGEEEEGSHAWRLKQEILSNMGEFSDLNTELENRFNESCKAIYEKAIEGYLEKQINQNPTQIGGEKQLSKTKSFELLNKKGEVIDSKPYIPTWWYVQARHYGCTIEYR